jgi:hypothetical protein
MADDFDGAFPTAAELARVTERALPADALSIDVLEVEEWTLAGPLADRIAAGGESAKTAWSEQLDKQLAGKAGGAIASAEMGCVARELGRFYLEKEAQPAEELRRFVVGRCGAAAVGVDAAFLSGNVPDDVTEAAIQEKWRGQVDDLIRKEIDTGNRALGIWFGRAKGRVVVAVAGGSRSVHVEAAALVPAEDGTVAFRGELLVPAANVRALINVGPHGVAECAVDASVPLPRFAFRCTPSATDGTAAIELAAFPAGRVLGKTALDVLVSPDRSLPATFRRAAPVAASGDGDAALVGVLNAIRAQGGMQPVHVSTAQSRTALEVAPYYFAALFGKLEETVADKVVLGLRAGWDVGGQVRHGQFTAAVTTRTDELARLVTSALARPFGREALLDPAVTEIALGLLREPRHQVMAAVFATYALLEIDHAPMASRVLDALNTQRAQRGHEAAVFLGGIDARTQDAIEKVRAGLWTPTQALDDLISAAAASQRYQDAKGWLLQMSSLDDLKLPDELVSHPRLAIAPVVVGYRASGEPWWRTAVLVVIASVPEGEERPVLRLPGK